MDVRNNFETLGALLGVDPTRTPAAQSKGNAAATTPAAWSGDSATLSGAASGLAQSVSGEGVRTEKVAAVQAALAAGTYDVPASAVANKLVDVMLVSGS